MVYTDEEFNPIVMRRESLSDQEFEKIMSYPVSTAPVIDARWLIEMVRQRNELQ